MRTSSTRGQARDTHVLTYYPLTHVLTVAVPGHGDRVCAAAEPRRRRGARLLQAGAARVPRGVLVLTMHLPCTHNVLTYCVPTVYPGAARVRRGVVAAQEALHHQGLGARRGAAWLRLLRRGLRAAGGLTLTQTLTPNPNPSPNPNPNPNPSPSPNPNPNPNPLGLQEGFAHVVENEAEWRAEFGRD
eukprot:scaffold119721_cov65-Phaeocystis_antarctica.AAC.1